MTPAWFQGRGRKRPERPVGLPAALLGEHTNPASYLADPGLVDAVNVALHLGQPLLLTGQPGTGKTQLAFRLAWELGFDAPLVFETKSTSTARDLFYTYDALGRFQATQAGGAAPRALHYLHWNALGLAILRANAPERVAHLLLEEARHRAPRRSVVLIDEVDKAPRDFPNDLLNEVEGMYFKVVELGNEKVAAAEDLRPVVILTSNSEKNLPEAFLRRSVFYHIPFPSREELVRIVASRLGERVEAEGRFVDTALELFLELRQPSSGLTKKPSTGEFLAWLRFLVEQAPDSSDAVARDAVFRGLESRRQALCCLVKLTEDLERAEKVVERWQESRGN